jgi:FemAB-related protein (PEP-CTERM system-associated)
MKHFVFGNHLISIPFFDMAGILADSPEAEQALLSTAVDLARDLRARTLELRHRKPLLSFNPTPSCIPEAPFPPSLPGSGHLSVRSHKARMLLELPESSDALMASFKSKLRSQIKRPLKEGLQTKMGGMELLDDFYKTFAVNMRDLGSPVHSKRLIRSVLTEFAPQARLVIVYKDTAPVACALIVGFGRTLENPWASALRRYARLSPNMLLYWSMLAYGCENGYRVFDFGRSTPEEGTYKFKAQWGARPEPLHWHYFSFNGITGEDGLDEKAHFGRAVQYWQKLPVAATKLIGPMIRKHIGL